jgi:hypothetical protein
MNTASTLQTPHRAVSVFWPIVLIGVGVIWLMVNQGTILTNPIEGLIGFWPLLLIVAGVELLVSRTGWLGTLVSAALGIAVVAGAIFYLTAPNAIATPTWFNWNLTVRNTLVQTEDIAQPLENTRALKFEMNLPGGFGSIKPVTNPANLVEGSVAHLGALTNRIQRNGDTASVLLRTDTRDNQWFDFFLGTQRWDVRLNPTVPLTLDLMVGSGIHSFDLRAFAVNGIALQQGSGAVTFQLPPNGQYHFKINMGSGIANVALPKGMATRVNYEIGSGWLNVNNVRRVRGNDARGVYESDGFTESGAYVIFDVDMGSGVVVIR